MRTGSHGAVQIVHVGGPLDLLAGVQLANTLPGLLGDARVLMLILDFQQVPDLDAAGLRMVRAVNGACGPKRQLRIVASAAVELVLNRDGLAHLLGTSAEVQELLA